MDMDTLPAYSDCSPPVELQEELAPFCLLRVTALPYQALDALRMPETEMLLERIVRAEESMERHRAELTDLLHGLVPKLDHHPGLRRNVLNLRRDIHNRRPSKVSPEDGSLPLELLDAPDRERLSDWFQAQRELADAERALEPVMLREIQTHLRPALRRPLETASFRKGLAFASQSVARDVARKRISTLPRPDNLERSLLGYLGRAAAKTSPFSSFMSLSVVAVDRDSDAAPPQAFDATLTSGIRLNRGAISRLHRLSLREAADAAHPPRLFANPTLKP
jgi:hypothetical protein